MINPYAQSFMIAARTADRTTPVLRPLQKTEKPRRYRLPFLRKKERADQKFVWPAPRHWKTSAKDI